MKEVKRKRAVKKMRKEVPRRGNQDGEENEKQESSRYRREDDGSVKIRRKGSLE